MNSTQLKKATPDHDIHPLIQKRWSPRSFSEKAISNTALNQLFEAARWSASANNEQPWTYTYAFKDTPGFEKLWDCLAPGNQPWTKSAAVLFVAIKRNTFSANGNDNPWAEHDLGMANAQLLLQAAHQDIYGHLMAGFDKSKIQEVLNLDNDSTPICMGVLGYLGDKDKLEEPYKSREEAPRDRKMIQEFITQL